MGFKLSKVYMTGKGYSFLFLWTKQGNRHFKRMCFLAYLGYNKNMRKILKVLTSRLFIVAPLVILQFAFFVMLFYSVAYTERLLPFLSLMSIIFCIYVINRNEDPSYKIAWIIVILAAPVIGIPLYVLAGNRHVPKKLYNGTVRATDQMDDLLVKSVNIDDCDDVDGGAKKMFRYGRKRVGFPVYQHTKSEYYSSGEEWFPHYLEALRQAKHFIFIETFIIDQGSMWNEVLTILKDKVKEGVEVKIIYDDFGSITLPHHYSRYLRELGIEAHRFNHVRARFIIQMNNRDHRKITVIDNQVAFTGGVNFADEYVNRIERFGYWKDSAIRIEGEAVWSFTVMFLGLLSYVRSKNEPVVEYEKYRINYSVEGDGGYYQPWADTPTDKESVALNMHVHMVKHARNYIYIDTPYLILNETMKQELILAAKSGVDVRILTPHIPDKKLVFQITRGFYRELIDAGVRIYEFLPGFNHTKNFVSDDNIAIVGSANTDYRSYFLHFENGCLMYNTSEIMKIKQNFLDAIEKSHEVTIEDTEKVFVLVRIVRAVLNLFIPLL